MFSSNIWNHLLAFVKSRQRLRLASERLRLQPVASPNLPNEFHDVYRGTNRYFTWLRMLPEIIREYRSPFTPTTVEDTRKNLHHFVLRGLEIDKSRYLIGNYEVPSELHARNPLYTPSFHFSGNSRITSKVWRSNPEFYPFLKSSVWWEKN